MVCHVLVFYIIFDRNITLKIVMSHKIDIYHYWTKCYENSNMCTCINNSLCLLPVSLSSIFSNLSLIEYRMISKLDY